MVAQKLFTVVTQFQFEIAAALAQSKQLQDAVGNISNAATALQQQLVQVPNMLLGAFAGYFTISNVFQAAVGSQQKLQKASLALTNVISANMDTMSGNVQNFNERFLSSKQIIEDVARTANKFNLDESAMVATFESLSAMLAPKGLAGVNFQVAEELSRGLLKSAPLLGIDPFLVQNQLREIIEGRSGLQNTLFVRLAAETPAFEGIAKGTESISKAFNALPTTERVERLRRGLLTFANDMDVVHGNARLLSSLLVRIKNQFFGINSVLRPLGEVIVPKLEMALVGISNIIETKVRPFVVILADLLQKAFDNPEKVYAIWHQFRNLNTDLARTGSLLQGLGIADFTLAASGFVLTSKALRGLISGVGLPGLADVLGKIGLLSKRASTSLSGFLGTDVLYTAFQGIMNARGVFGKLVASFGFGFTTLGFVLRRVLMPVALLTTGFSILSRAAGYVQAEIYKKIFGIWQAIVTGPGARIVSAVWDIIRIFDDLIDRAARSLATFAEVLIVDLEYLFYSEMGQAVANGIAWIAEMFRDGLMAMLSGLAFWGGLVQGFLGSVWTNFMALSRETDKVLMNILQIWGAFFKDFQRTFSVVLESITASLGYLSRGHFGMALESMQNIFRDDQTGANLREVMRGIDFSAKGFSNPFADALEMGMESYDDIRGLLVSNIGKDREERQVVNRNINQNININQAFREQQEPDRIARSLVKLLGDLAENPTQGRNGRAAMRSPFLTATEGL